MKKTQSSEWRHPLFGAGRCNINSGAPEEWRGCTTICRLGDLHLLKMWHIGVSLGHAWNNYACVVWNPHTAKDCTLLDMAQV